MRVPAFAVRPRTPLPLPANFLAACSFSQLTPPHSRLTLNFQLAAGEAGKAVRIGRGPATVIGSSSRKPGHPPLAQRLAPFARKNAAGSPRGSRGAVFVFRGNSRQDR